MPCQSRLAFLNIMIGLCRFEAAVAAAEKARDLDPGNAEVGMILNNVRLVAKARAQGNDLFKAAKFSDASIAHGEGLKYDPSNLVKCCLTTKIHLNTDLSVCRNKSCHRHDIIVDPN